LCVGIGTGLGGAFVIGGNVVRGVHGAAGHIGHTLHPAVAGEPCACGSVSHVERATCGTAISARFQGRNMGDELDPTLMGDEVARRANEGDLDAIAVLETAGRVLGESIGSWCNILDPELVVLSGSVTGAGPFWRRALDEGFKSQALAPLADTPILYAALGGDAPLVGAVEFARDQQQ
ncbi:MAG: ROK family protein, partial [Eggerthellaceae bacterium]|nr:ROK family protein [Eggerthellaceae bacterium]